MNNNISGVRTDLYIEKRFRELILDTNVKVLKDRDNNIDYNTIYFSNLNNREKIINILVNELQYFINKLQLPNKFHVLIIGLGNDNHTADSVGPKVLQHIKVNSYLTSLGVKINTNIVSALEPGVLGETGIETRRIVESVTEEINPDLVIFIDAFVSQNINYLNKTIQISDGSIIPGSGLNGISFEINSKTLKKPIIIIGIPTAIEIEINSLTYILSTKAIDDYVDKISEIIGLSLNRVLFS